jgi:chromatin remodeling complex protein RSC6
VAVQPSEPAAAQDDVVGRVAEALEKAQSIAAAGKDLANLCKSIQKDVAKLARRRTTAASKKAAKQAGGDGPKKLSGFAKPTALSPELCDFLAVPHSTTMARTEVTRMINKYIKEKDLQNPQDRRSINPDPKLGALLKLQPGQQLTYFNLQSFLRPQFEKAPSA